MTPPETPIFTEMDNLYGLGGRKCTFRVTQKTPKYTPILLVRKPLFFRVPPPFWGVWAWDSVAILPPGENL